MKLDTTSNMLIGSFILENDIDGGIQDRKEVESQQRKSKDCVTYVKSEDCEWLKYGIQKSAINFFLSTTPCQDGTCDNASEIEV